MTIGAWQSRGMGVETIRYFTAAGLVAGLKSLWKHPAINDDQAWPACHFNRTPKWLGVKSG